MTKFCQQFPKWLRPTRLILGLCIGLFLGCSTSDKPTADKIQEAKALATKPDASLVERHAATIEAYSAGDSEYNGFYNQFEFKATLQNTTVTNSLLNLQADYFKWEDSKQKAENEKVRAEMAATTEVFVSFFTPERKNDNLADRKSIWRVFIDAGGKRYTGKVKKSKRLLAELQAMYPYHTRWTTPYVVVFPVPVSLIEQFDSTLTITGPLGARSINFPKM